jgi:hypothetical protein
MVLDCLREVSTLPPLCKNLRVMLADNMKTISVAIALSGLIFGCSSGTSQSPSQVTCSVCAGFSAVVAVVTCTGTVDDCISKPGGCLLPAPSGMNGSVELMTGNWSAVGGGEQGPYAISAGDGSGGSLEIIQLAGSGIIDVVDQCPMAASSAPNTCHLCSAQNAIACTTTLQDCVDSGNGTCDITEPNYETLPNGGGLIPTGTFGVYFSLTPSTDICSFAGGTYNIPCTSSDTTIDATRTDQPPATQALDFPIVMSCT